MVVRIGAVLTAVFATAAVSATATAVLGQAPASVSCRVDTLTAGFPAAWLGTTTGQVTIRARNVDVPGGVVERVAQALHRPTRLDVVANELGFSAGEPIDSVRILESVRRLRRTSLFSEVLLEGSRCGPSAITDFTLYTRDAWSLRADFRTGRIASHASLADVNLGGTGRSLSVRGEESDVRRSVTVSVSDPYLFDTHVRGTLLLRNYADGRAWNWSVRSREFSPRDVWRGTLLSAQLRRLSDDLQTATHTDIERRSATLALSRLVRLRPKSAWAFALGVEVERANVVVQSPGTSLGSPELHREFTAALVGLERRAIEYSSIDWLVPGQAPAELPIGVDGELVLGVGHDRTNNARIIHVDGWMGGTTRPTRGTVVTGGVWWSGYRSRDSLFNGSLRLAVATYQRARRGTWSVRAAVERLQNPDPDVVALATADPLLRALAPDSRLAERALSVNVERSVHIKAVDRRWVADAAIFATYTEHRRSVGPDVSSPLNPSALILGLGLRRILNQPTQAPLRLDIGRAVWRSSRLPDRWIVVLSTVPWITAGRMRDGLRDVR